MIQKTAEQNLEVVAYSKDWPERFQEASVRVLPAFGETLIALHHGGSTAVPGLAAKPIIDLVAEITSLVSLDERRSSFEAIGLEWLGENEMPGRRYMRARDVHTGQHMFHLHCWEAGHPEIERHLVFRDYLIAHPEAANEYGDLKRALADKFRTDRRSYTEAKSDFIRSIDVVAAIWAKAGR